ncbi:hypothetical protein [Chondromyces crocatus]|uniref:Lipoprotein n=1 Tax=Chondromyces crocatus TaxID=52 RepID=A0A0K1EME5_CHOCO|nr:hypothetical protein [Chondromyces crocatus]AKT42060.1 uncharacterized protein CMC5_062830 [Chondromyces crocatus]
MMHLSKMAGLMAVLALGVACGSEGPEDDVLLDEDSGGDGLAPMTAPADSQTPSEVAESECLLLDTSKTYSGSAFGSNGDDTYPLDGRPIARVELNRTIGCGRLFCVGRGNATIARQDSEAVVVHYWHDLGTRLEYHLRVWVQC